MIESIILQAAQNLSDVITTPPIVATPTPSVVDLIDSLLARSQGILVLVAAILSSPGIVALANYFKKSKERNAANEMLGYLAAQVKDIREKGVKPYGDFAYEMLTDEQKKIVDEKVKPIVQEADDKAKHLSDELEKLVPRLNPTSRAAYRSV